MAEKESLFQRLSAGLAKTKASILTGLDRVFSGSRALDEDFYEALEETLLLGDLGVETTLEILEELRQEVKEKGLSEPTQCRQLLMENIQRKLQENQRTYPFEEETSVILVTGVNGVGKTTTIGKLALQLKEQGRRILLAACDTFRAAASDQLSVWAERAGVELIRGQEGADPAAVLYDAVSAARARKVDVLLVDTAGRLHNKKNLMEELGKMDRVLTRAFPEAHRETLIVVDATTGQNALVQARQFQEAASATGVVLTKMDGTAKGGIAVAIEAELGIPIKYIGVGEGIRDLQKFSPELFVKALFDVPPSQEEKEKEES